MFYNFQLRDIFKLADKFRDCIRRGVQLRPVLEGEIKDFCPIFLGYFLKILSYIFRMVLLLLFCLCFFSTLETAFIRWFETLNQCCIDLNVFLIKLDLISSLCYKTELQKIKCFFFVWRQSDGLGLLRGQHSHGIQFFCCNAKTRRKSHPGMSNKLTTFVNYYFLNNTRHCVMNCICREI